MQQMDDEDDKMSVTTTTSDVEDDSSITQDDSPKMKRRKTVIRITKRKRHQQTSDHSGNLGSKFMKNFMDLANDLRKERVSESSNTSGGKFGNRKGSSKTRKSRRAMRAMTSLQQDKDIVLNKADAIQTKWQKMSKRNGGETSTNKVDSWLHFVRDTLTQSRTSLNTIGEEEKRSSLPWRKGVSRSSSVENMTVDEVKIRSLPKRASYAGGSVLNIITDEDETSLTTLNTPKQKDIVPSDNKPKEVIYSEIKRPPKMTGSKVTLQVPVHDISDGSDVSRPKSGISSRISEEEGEARANSIESQSDISENSDSGSNSRAPSVTFSKTNEYITNYREAQAANETMTAPDDVFIVP